MVLSGQMKSLQAAIKCFKSGPTAGKLNSTARTHGIPKATLKRHLMSSNKYAKGKKYFGRPTVLPPELENSLVNYVLELESMLIGCSRADIMKMAYDLADRNGLGHTFNNIKKRAGEHWYRDFMRRHKELSLRTAEATSMARAKGFNKTSVDEFYQKLEYLVDKYGFSAANIVNMDETGITTVQRPGKVIARKGKKQVGSLTSGERWVNTTAVCSMTASGNYIPPMLIYRRNRMAEALMEGRPAGCIISNNESGYMTQVLFMDYLKHLVGFMKFIKDNPGLLILDGHSSHTKSVEAIEYARENGVHILSLPPHTTHRLQPYDRTLYKSLMTHFNNECDRWIRIENRGISIFAITRLFSTAYCKAATMENAIIGFKCTGIWPIDRNIWNDSDFADASRFEVDDCEFETDGPRELQSEGTEPTILQSTTEIQQCHSPKNIEPVTVVKPSTTVDLAEFEPVADLTTEPSILYSANPVEQSTSTPTIELSATDCDYMPIILTDDCNELIIELSTKTSSYNRNRQIIKTNPDGRCFFRSVVICSNSELQNLQRDENCNPVDIRRKLQELNEADRLRASVLEHMIANFDLYKELMCSFTLNADMPVGKSFTSLEDRISAMPNQTEMIGELEILATSRFLERQINIEIQGNIIKYSPEFKAKPFTLLYEYLADDVGHYDSIIDRPTDEPLQGIEPKQTTNFITPEMLSPIPRVEKNKTRKMSRSEIITSSPYEVSLMKKASIQKQKKPNKQLKKKKTIQSKKKLDFSGKESWYCPLCEEDRKETMVLCVHCNTYIHETCAGGIPPNYVCDICQ